MPKIELKNEYVKLWISYKSYFEPFGDAEVGRLTRAMIEYRSTGAEPEFNGNERYVWPAIKRDIDESLKAMEDIALRNKNNGAKGGRPKKNQENPKNPVGFSETQNNPPVFSETQKTQGKGQGKGQGYCSPPCEGPPSPQPAAPVRHTRSENGWVKLTDEEYAALVRDLGQAELDRCIAYVDESAQMSGNKNKWKDWNLVLRKCHREQWGITGRTGGKVVMASVKQTPSDLQKAALARLMSGES